MVSSGVVLNETLYSFFDVIIKTKFRVSMFNQGDIHKVRTQAKGEGRRSYQKRTSIILVM